jgi:GntR family transcriptional regulator
MTLNLIRLDTASFTPLYEQIKKNLKGRVASGALRPGDTLPSIRDLAVTLLVNPNTVARAYRELEKEGFIVTRRGKGCFVSEKAARQMRAGRWGELNKLLDQVAEEARRLDLSPKAVLKLLDRRRRTPARGHQGRKKP